MTNFPNNGPRNTDQPVRDFFDRYYQSRVEYAASEVDSVIGFFDKRGFGEASSSSISATLLQQAKRDGVSTFKLLDTLKGLNDAQLSALVTEMLNFSRIKSSVLGYKDPNTTNYFEARNIIS
jgi:hypothetical protein